MSKTNIKMDKPTYIINPEKGIIVCKIKAHAEIDNYPNIYFGTSTINKVKKKFHINYPNSWFIFKAVAKLHKEDKWDETVGKRIAESKCKRKIYEFYFKMFDYMINEVIYNDINRFNQYTDNLMCCAYREAKHLKELMNIN